MDHLAAEPHDLSALRELLVDERARLLRQIDGLEATYQGLVDAADLEPPDDEHDPDGTTAYERAQVDSLLRTARVRLAETEDALEAMARGTYGACQRCGEAIPVERLAALVSTTRCIRCALS